MSKQSAYYRVPDIDDKDSKRLKQVIDGLHGVISVSINVSSDKVAVDYDSTGTNCDVIKNEIEGSGYDVQLIANEDHIM